MKRLNTAYMTVARKIAGKCRFQAVKNATSEEVRQMLGLPSVECKVRRARLIYLASLCKKGPIELTLLLENEGKLLPWAKQALDDLDALHAFHAHLLKEMPHPRDSFAAWRSLMTKYPGPWKQIVNQYIEYASPCERSKHITTACAASFKCDMCVDKP
eukprot:1926078-Karenia_brevis.AAC.1